MVSKPREANPTPPTGTLGLLAWGFRATCSFCNSLVVRSTVYPCSLKFPPLLSLDPGLRTLTLGFLGHLVTCVSFKVLGNLRDWGGWWKGRHGLRSQQAGP